VIPGATVSAIESATGIKTDTVTGANGRYSFPSIRPTTYEIRAELTGFKTVRRTDVTLQANQNLTVNITLELGDLAETITVAGEAATVDISSATISEVVDHARIVELPIAGREVARLQTLVAGTVLASVSEETGKSIPGAVRISANGAGERQNSYRLDGANNTDPYFQENQSFPFPRRTPGVLDSDVELQRVAWQQCGRRRQRRHALGDEHFPWRGVRVPPRSDVQREGLLRRREGLPQAQSVRRICRRSDQEEQHVLLRRLAAYAHHQPRIRAHQVRAHGRSASGRLLELLAGVPAALQPGDGAAIRQQPDSFQFVGPGCGEGICSVANVHSANGQVTVPRATGQDSNQIVAKVDQQLARTTSLSSVTSSTTSTTRRSSFRRISSATQVRVSSRIRAVRAS
jgi:hypothetical protein